MHRFQFAAAFWAKMISGIRHEVYPKGNKRFTVSRYDCVAWYGQIVVVVAWHWPSFQCVCVCVWVSPCLYSAHPTGHPIAPDFWLPFFNPSVSHSLTRVSSEKPPWFINKKCHRCTLSFSCFPLPDHWWERERDGESERGRGCPINLNTLFINMIQLFLLCGSL